jgi:hypothetical protein
MKKLRNNKGREYISNELDSFCKEHRIDRERTQWDTPQQNGVAECFNRTLAEGITTLLNKAKLPATMWVDTASAFVHVHNRLPPLDGHQASPCELWDGHVPSAKLFHTWGCEAYIHVQKNQREQFSSHAKHCIFIRYPPDYTGWKFLNLESGKEVISDSAVFTRRCSLARYKRNSLPFLVLYNRFSPSF